MSLKCLRLKLRSLNLSMFIIIEASETNPEAFTQLKTRLRNMAAAEPRRDEAGRPIYTTLKNGVQVPLIKSEWRRGIIESNPDSGWIRNEVLYASEDIEYHGDTLEVVKVPEGRLDKYISSHVACTSVNAFLPENFIEELCKNKPNWWINRYVFSSFSYSEGLVYPSAPLCKVDSFAIPPHWTRIISCDYGLRDEIGSASLR